MRKIQNQWWLRKAEEVQLATDSKNSKYQREVWATAVNFAPLKSKDGHTTLTQPEDIHVCVTTTMNFVIAIQLLMNLYKIALINGSQLSLLMKYLLGTK